jgi:hypothetical protein
MTEQIQNPKSKIQNPNTSLARISRVLLPPTIIIAALIAYRLIAIGPRQPAIVLPRNEPTKIAARYSDYRVVTDEQLVAVLDRVKPPAGPANTNNYVHALRLWGPTADFGDQAVPCGRQLRDYFLSDAAFRQLAGDAAPPLFNRGRDGIEVRSYDDGVSDRVTSSYHTDDLVATMAETGALLNTPLHLRDGDVQVSDLLKTALMRFHLDQLEYEWTTIAYARHVFPERGWQNKFGERIDVDALVEELISHQPDLGPCNGLHRLEALVVLYRADEQYQILSGRTKLKMLLYMKRASQALVQAQTADGYWTRQWPRGASASKVAKDSTVSLHDKLLVTGHHLEWLALAPEQVQPPRETVIRAAQWLSRALIEMDEKDLLEAYGPYTHAARALCLWRGVEPFDFWKEHHAPKVASVQTR